MRRVVLASVSALAMACGSTLPHPAFAPQPSTALTEVDQVPPPARVELVPARPDPLAVWVDGEWIWRRGRWAWLTGRWVLPPAGATFRAWAFVRGADGRLWSAPGAWLDASGAPLELKPLAVASVEAGAIVDADGVSQTTGPILHERPHAAAAEAPESMTPASKGSVAPANP
ncbi:MAG TPA: hypothetical protein VGL81_16175 [Polyangiaceae bacterium]|jgi:hypothetical protein